MQLICFLNSTAFYERVALYSHSEMYRIDYSDVSIEFFVSILMTSSIIP